MMQNKPVMCVDLKVGFSCNNNCTHCVAADKVKAGDLSLARVRKEIDYYCDKYGTLDLLLTGGEVTIRPDFDRILDHVDRKKAQRKIRLCYIQTNGRALSVREKALRFAKTVDGFAIAIHGHTARLHDGITSRKDSFRETITAVHNLMECGARIISQTVISRRNAPHLLSIYKFIVEELRISRGMITFPHPNGNACSPKIVPTYEDIKEQLNQTVHYLNEVNFDYLAEMIPPCVVERDIRKPFIEMSLQRTKREVVGTDASLGDSSRDLQYHELLSGEYRKAPFCKTCRYDHGCVGVWKEYHSFYEWSGLRAIH